MQMCQCEPLEEVCRDPEVILNWPRVIGILDYIFSHETLIVDALQLSSFVLLTPNIILPGSIIFTLLVGYSIMMIRRVSEASEPHSNLASLVILITV